MEAGHLRENPQTPQQQEPLQAITSGLQKADGPSFSGKQSSHQTQRNNKNLTSRRFKQQPMCTPLAPTRNKIIYKTACSDGPNSGSGKPQNRLRTKETPYICSLMRNAATLATPETKCLLMHLPGSARSCQNSLGSHRDGTYQSKSSA